jgi:DNA-binding transcriptional regulator YhcF (GntR family)
MAKLLDEYAAIVPWEVSTPQTNEGFIRRTIKPALGHLQVRKMRGPILDKLYAELKRCGDLSCTGRPFTEHRNIPALVINPRDPRPAWQQVTGTLTEAIRSGFLASGDELPSITELVALQGIGTGVMRHALEALAADGLTLVRRGQTAIVAGNPSSTPQGARRRPGPAEHRRASRPQLRRRDHAAALCRPGKDGWDWVAGVHAGQLQRLAQEASATGRSASDP